MAQKKILISINASWNILNFRAGLIRALIARGYRVMAVAPNDAYSERLKDLGVEYYALEMDKKGVSPRQDILLLARYYRLLRRLKPSIFLGYTAKPNVYGSLAAHVLGIPVINNVSGLGTAFIKQGLLTQVVSLLYRLAFARSKCVFFQNEEDLELFTSGKLVSRAQARLISGSGVDLERFRPLPYGQDADPHFTFIMIARLLWDKGVGEFVEAARLVRKEVPATRFQMLGFADFANRTAVTRAEIDKWVDEGLIDYLGPSDDVRPFIAGADCVVLPSYREGLPRALLEGAAMAKPLLATDAPGCRQVVDDGANGFLCQVRNARSLADQMLKMISLPADDRKRMGMAGRAKVEAYYDERFTIQSYLDEIEKALSLA